MTKDTKMDKPKYVNSTVACAVFAFLLTFGFVWTSFYADAPFTAFMEGLVIGLGAVLGKRLWQKWGGKKTGFRTDAQQASTKKPKAEDEFIDD